MSAVFRCLWLGVLVVAVRAGVPVRVEPVMGKNGMVVAGHPQAAEAGWAVLQAGGNAIDAAVATSLALGVAEPYGSGLGGKLMLLYYEAKTGRIYAVDAMDAAGSVDPAKYLGQPVEERGTGYASVCVPGLAAGLWTAHQRWGQSPWAAAVQPAIDLARQGFRILPKTREQFAEQERKLRRGDREIARLYLPAGALPEVGTILANEDLARTMEALARQGRDGFYRGPIAEAIATASRRGGGWLTLADLAGYEARVGDPVTLTFRGYTLFSGPPPTSGSALFFPILKALEKETFDGGPLRRAANLDRIGRVWRAAHPAIGRAVGDVPESRFLFEKLIAPDAIEDLRARAFGPPGARRKVARLDGSDAESPFYESAMAATTHFAVADRAGNVVCATQSQSLHFGAGVVPPGTGVVMNNSMSNFSTTDPANPNYVAPGRRPRSTIGPTIVLQRGRPVLAIGIPGSARIPTALLQALLDRLALNRPLAEAIGDTRVHFLSPLRSGEPDAFEAEQSFPAVEAEALRALGWKVVLREAAGTGRYFGGINAIEFRPDGTMVGYADPRRTNAAKGF
ncbi:MAG: gamma-glutamyltransferase family protein [Verrucomicrobia bacterium]|nr:gamma-glutamyltransferase family protein [Verrucomicrobiota bacterium]